MFEGLLPGGVGGFIYCIVNLQDFERQAEDEMSSAASLFAVMARETPSQPPPNPLDLGEESAVVTCPNCLSENTEEANRDHQIFYCKDCNTFFNRPK